jgi:hypothetical protein
MEVLLIRTITQESNEAKMARFLHGLNDEISDFVEMFPYDMLQDVVNQAIQVEKKNLRDGRSHSFQNRTTLSSWHDHISPTSHNPRVHHRRNLQTQRPPHPLFVINIGDPQFQQGHPPHHQQQKVLHAAAIY